MADPVTPNETPQSAGPETPQTPEPAPRQSSPAPSATPTPPASGPLAALEAKFYEWFVHKAPFQLPKGLTDFIVKFGPWITLVIGILLLPVIFGLIGLLLWAGSLLTASAAYGYSSGSNLFGWISLIALVVQVVIMFVSIPMLLKRRRAGWQLIFYASLIGFAYNIISSLANGIYGLGSLIMGVILLVVNLYVLFQIRRYYVK